MMRIADNVARQRRSSSNNTDDSLGQEASQTMEALFATDSVTTLPVFRPCIGMDKDEIITIARKIDTFETACLPYDDCCSLFTPRHPKTRPGIAQIQAQEERLDVDGLIAAVSNEKILIDR